MIAQHTGGADEEGQSRDLGRVPMVLMIDCTLERGEEEPGMTLGSMAVGKMPSPFGTWQSWGVVWRPGHARS